MPTVEQLFKQIKEHEDITKTAAVKKTAIASPARAEGAAAEVGHVLNDVLGSNMADTKIRIKKKLEEVSGAQRAQEGLGSGGAEEMPAAIQAPALGDKMPPGGEAPKAASVQGKLAAFLGKKAEKAPEAEAKKEEAAAKKEAAPAEDAEKVAYEKLAEEHYAAGRIMAHGFMDELNELLG